jgi:uncharacterized protein YndB with AHSA1/START domain
MRFRCPLVAVALLATVTTLDAQTSVDLMAGKVKTERTVRLETTVDASPAEVYRLWTTADGVKRFFAPAARIDARPGGEYTILFAPAQDPQGLSHGTKGARVLKLVDGKEAWFEWITFTADTLLGTSAPPVAPRSERDVVPLPTWVELSFEPLDGGKRTAVHFAHYGFRDGARWEASYQWFSRAWAGVLESLKAECAKSSS